MWRVGRGLLMLGTTGWALQLEAPRFTTRAMTAEETKKLEFFILIETDFGSKSPAMHNAAFAELALPHVYGVCELPKELEDASSAASRELARRFASPTFGGASVTIPHKQVVTPFLDRLTEAATTIGAVNTVIPTDDGLIGDNTDWLGVCEAIEAALERRGRRPDSNKALLVGTGGTARAAAFALTDGRKIRGAQPYDLYVTARDLQKAADLAAAFGGKALDLASTETTHDLYASGGFAVVVSTIPGDARYVLPQDALASKPAVLDAAYKPADTALILQAKQAGCAVAQGATMLVQQGIAQFELWTGLRAPRDVMRAAVFDGVPDLESGSPLDDSSDL